MLAKGWLLGLQFYAILENGVYFEITEKAVKQAMQIKEAFNKKGIPSYIESPTNQQFVILENGQMNALAKNFVFEFEKKIDESHTCVRFCTAWYTKEEEIEALIKEIELL
jgi:threonine aldolase